MDLEKELKKNRRLRYRFLRRLERYSTYGEYRIIMESRSSRNYYYLVKKGEPSKNRKYAGTDNDKTIIAIKEKRFLEKSLKTLNECIEAIEKSIKAYRFYDANDLNDSLPRAYRLSEEQLNDVIGKSDAAKWREKALTRKAEIENVIGAWHPEELKHRANNGVWMRSKSEVLLANAFIAANIEFVYELPIKIGGKWFRPDFTIFHPITGEIIIWEHIGMLHLEDYRKDFAYKMDKYLSAGFAIGVDLILSFDNMRGEINMEAIDKMISSLMSDDTGTKASAYSKIRHTDL